MRFWHATMLGLMSIGLCSSPTSAAGDNRPRLPRHVDTRQSAHLFDIDDVRSQGYQDWINDAIAKLSGDDEADQYKGADELSLAIISPPVRAKVLAALEPHLNTSSSSFRLRCIRAYGHWATVAQVHQLLDVVANPPHPPNMSGAEPCWAAAVAALVRLDPTAAMKAADTRSADFFFHADLARELQFLTTLGGRAQADAFALLKHLDPRDAAVSLSVVEAEKLLSSDSAGDRTRGATALAHAIVVPAERQRVLDLLMPHLMGSNGRARLVFVNAFVHWATRHDVPTLLAVVATPANITGLYGHEECWAAATAGLARLDPNAALAAIKARASNSTYLARLRFQLEPLAQQTGPSANIAAWLLGEFKSYSLYSPTPPHFLPDLPASPEPRPVNAPGALRT